MRGATVDPATIATTFAIGTLTGGLSVALVNFVKFNGRLIRLETTMTMHLQAERIWQENLDRKIERLLDQAGATEEEKQA